MNDEKVYDNLDEFMDANNENGEENDIENNEENMIKGDPDEVKREEEERIRKLFFQTLEKRWKRLQTNENKGKYNKRVANKTPYKTRAKQNKLKKKAQMKARANSRKK